MSNIKYVIKFTQIFSFLIVFNLVSVKSIHSTTPKQTTDNNNKTVYTDFGLPTHRRDGGSRGSSDNCVASAKNQNLIALIPEQTIVANASATPKLFFYVPEITNQKSLEFVLRNEKDELMYEAFLSTKGKGIMSIEIPANLDFDLLGTEKNYHWYLSMICNEQQRSHDIVVEGWMRQEKIDPAVREQLQTANNSVEQAEVYRDRGFWYDALSVLAENVSVTKEPVVQQKWSQMLESIGLKELASQPFVETELLKESVLQ